MPYVPANVPEEITPAYLAEELQRIANAYNVIEAIGVLAFNPLFVFVQAVTVTPAILQFFDQRGPSEQISDGPINTDPRIHPVNQILVKPPGVYLVNFGGSLAHGVGLEILFELYEDGNPRGIGAQLTAFQASLQSRVSLTGIIAVVADTLLDVRVSVPSGTADISMEFGNFNVIKLRDLRTRFS